MKAESTYWRMDKRSEHARGPRGGWACGLHFGSHTRARLLAGAIVALLLVLAVPGRAAVTAGNWWDASYAYRKKITISAGSYTAPASTVTVLSFDHAALVSAGQSRADGNDIRVLYWSGANWTELPRALASASSWNSGSSKILFKNQAEITSGDSDDNYYLYYGNASAGGPPTGAPAARVFMTEQLAEQSTTSSTFTDVPSSTLTFTPGDASETWLIFVSGVLRSSSTAETAAEMQLLINGAAVDLWGHQNDNAGTPNGAGFITFERITGTTAAQTIQPQFRAAAGTTYVSSLRVVAALVPPDADTQFTETDATTQQTGSNLVLQTLSFDPPNAKQYLILGKLSQHEYPGGSTARAWLEDDSGNAHPDAPSGTRFSDARAAWQPLFVAFHKALPASTRTFRLRGTSSSNGSEASEWRYRRIMALRTDAWEAVEYNESLSQSTTTSGTFQTKNSLATAVPPAARDYLVIQAARISGDSTSTTARKAGELRDGGTTLVRTDHRINRDGSASEGYHHMIGVASVKNTNASVTYTNGYLSPSGITVQAAESTITALRYHEPSTALASQEAVPTVTFTSTGQSLIESGGTMTVTVQLSTVCTQNVTIPFSLGGTAVSPADYTITPSPLVITAGNTTTTITITIADDFVHEADETIVITMGNPTNAGQGAITVHTATIRDDEPPGVLLTESAGATNITEGGATDTYTVVLLSQPTADVTVTINTDGQATVNPASLTFTAGDWNASQTVTVTAVNDAVAEGPHDSTIAHVVTSADGDYNGITVADVIANITDNDTAGVTITESGGSTDIVEGGATDSYTVVLTSEPAADVTVTMGMDGQANANPASLTFTAANWNASRTVTVTAVNDAMAEGNHTSTITHSTASSDAFYNGLVVADVIANITDNDIPSVTITESAGSTNITESGATDTYTLILTTEPMDDVTVMIGTDGQATVDPALLTFGSADWDIPQTVTVTAVNDAVAEGNHTSTITHTVASADSDYDGIAAADVVANITDNDNAGVTVTESAGSTDIVEGGATDSYTVVLTSEPTANVTITIGTDGQASVNPASLTFTAGNWSVSRAVTVTAVNDAVAEGNHTSTITHTAASADAFYDGFAVTGVTANITDNDTAGVTVTESAGSTNVTEGGATDAYTLVLTSQPIADVVVTAQPDAQSDLGAGPGNAIQLTFTAADWNVSQAVTVTADDDVVAEGNHSSTITHSAASADALYNGPAVATVTANITDNDHCYVNFTTAGQSLIESGGVMTATVQLSTVCAQDVTIPFTMGGTATDPDDYTITPSPLVIAAGDTTATITITINDDFVNEDDETVIITLDDPTNALKGVLAVHTATIRDDEPPGVAVAESDSSTDISEAGAVDTYTVVLLSQPIADVTVAIATDGQSDVNPASLTFTAGDWNIPQAVTVSAIDDDVAEGVHGSTITHTATSADGDYNGIAVADVIANITDDDTAGVAITESGGSTDIVEGGATDAYTVVLTSQPLADVTITITGDSQAIFNPASLTFTAGNWNVPQTVTVTSVDDTVAEGNHTSTLAHAAVSADGLYNGTAIGDVTARITDNDTAGVTITESGGSTDIVEGGATDAYTVVLTSEPIADVTITITGDSQADVNPASLTFTAADWDVPQTVTVTSVDDTVAEANHTSTLAHAAVSADGLYNGIAIADVTARITDNDSAGVTITESGGSTDIVEGGATDTYTVVLTSEPTADVTVTITDDSRADVNPASLVFTAADWNVPQNVTVTAVNDAVAEGNHTSTIAHTAASADTFYDGLAIASVTAHITDDDHSGGGSGSPPGGDDTPGDDQEPPDDGGETPGGDEPGQDEPPPRIDIEIEPAEAGTVLLVAATDSLCGDASGVHLTAQPAEGYVFTGWGGDLAGNENPLDVCVSGPLRVVARFSRTDPPSHEEQITTYHTTHYGLCAPLGIGMLGITGFGLLLMKRMPAYRDIKHGRQGHVTRCRRTQGSDTSQLNRTQP